jgi:hypothetical protein
MAVADAYLEISGAVAVAARWEDDQLRTADWWVAGHDPRAASPRPAPTPVIVAGGPPPAELRVDGRAFGRYADRVKGDGAGTFEEFEALVRTGRVLAEPPRWMLLRPPNVILLVLVGEDVEADGAWVATAVRQDDGQAAALVVNSCVSKAWYEAGGLAGKRARQAIAAQPAELLHRVARPGTDLRAQWTAFRKAVVEHGMLLPSRPQATPPTLGDGDAYLALSGEVVASLVWSSQLLLTLTDVVAWPLEQTVRALRQ